MILVVAKNDHKLRIEVGYGLEGAIPDVVAKRVIREVIAPHFLASDFYGGIRDGTRTLMKLIDGEPLPPPPAQPQAATGADYQSLFVILLIVVVVAGGVLKAMLGRLFGSAATGVAAGFIAWLLAGALGAAAHCRRRGIRDGPGSAACAAITPAADGVAAAADSAVAAVSAAVAATSVAAAAASAAAEPQAAGGDSRCKSSA